MMIAKWRHIFLEIALRAIRRTHYDFGVWELGQENLTLDNFKKLNQGDGINFAPEETVRDAILQEITYTGLWKTHTINNDPTSYWIDREVKIELNKKEAISLDYEKKLFTPKQHADIDNYINDQKYFKIDIVFKRIQETNPKFGDMTGPCLIEAKRFRRVIVNHRTSKADVSEPQIEKIDRDILKLKLIRDYYSKNGRKLKIKEEYFEKFYTYILLWGLSPADFNLKSNVIANLTQKDLLRFEDSGDPGDPEAPIIKYLPIEWEFDKELVTKKLLWVTLIELK